MRSYRLADGVHLCASDEGAVFLDLKADSYTGLDPDQTSAMAGVVEDWPAVAEEGVSCEEVLSLAQTLCEEGLLVPASTAPREVTTLCVTPPQLVEVTSELLFWDQMTWRDVRMGHVFIFIQSLIATRLMLRLCRFESLVNRARRRKALHASTANPFRADHVRALLSAFFHIRTLFYSPKGNCLRDSLILLEFLAHYGVRPSWVTGVQIRPFGAHSWLQHDSFVLNGTAPYVRSYRPILVV